MADEPVPTQMQAVPRPVKTYHSAPYDRLALANTGFEGTGKTVFITGGATGVGLATATAFAKANVSRIILVARSPETLQTAKLNLKTKYPSVEILTHAVSITDSALMTSLLQDLASIDILIFSAYASHSFLPPTSVSTPQFKEPFSTNVFAQFEILKTFLALPSPTSGGQKTVLNISTVAAQAAIPTLVGYGASKAAFAAVVQHFADYEVLMKLEKERTRFFSYHPGVFYTPAAAKILPKEAEKQPWEDIRLAADFAVWLAGPQADFLSGRFLWAEWDVDELIALKDRVEKDSTFMKLGLVL